ncbi:MAG TPA: hypothetical protein PKK63_01585 [Bacillota bacterium]|nr:MAG: hypothetical protein BWY00_00470 [Firmicutes bacterium ADurb.Bin153]HNV34209.1 hypothetical protein [Bacillota bacterium]
MRQERMDKMREIFEKNEGFAKSAELFTNGIHMSQITYLVENGVIQRIKKGLYMWPGLTPEADLQYITASKVVPKGIICLKSALSYHGLIEETPWEIGMAVPRNYKVKLPLFPPIYMYAYNEAMYEAGAKTIEKGKSSFMIFDEEKSICDAVKFEKYMGRDVIKEAIRTYLKREGKDLARLTEYANICGVGQKLELMVSMLT